MSTPDLESLWNKVVERLAQDLPASQVAHLRSAELTSGDTENLDLTLPNKMVRERIEKERLDQRIREALAAEGDTRGLRLAVRTRRKRRREEHPEQGTLALAGPTLELSRDRRARPREDALHPNLNPKYTMDAFVVGDGNRLAHAVCEAVGGKPGGMYNPVFLYGGVGLGKTHLMQAVGHAVHENDPKARIRYVSSEVFINEYIEAVKGKTIERWRRQHRRLDVLLIDDVQFLTKSEKLQEEFFHTFNELYQAGKQILLTSDRSPKQLSDLEERLVSRFEQGVVIDVKPPDRETRMAILMCLAEAVGLDYEQGTLAMLAERIRSNIRVLEGAFNKVLALCSLGRDPAITVEHVRQVVEEYATDSSEAPRVVDVALIQDLTCEYFGRTKEELCGRRRNREIVRPRQVAMFLCHERTEETLEAIAKAFNKKDHTTVMHACDKIRGLVGQDDEIDAALRVLRKRIQTAVQDG